MLGCFLLFSFAGVGCCGLFWCGRKGPHAGARNRFVLFERPLVIMLCVEDPFFIVILFLFLCPAYYYGANFAFLACGAERTWRLFSAATSVCVGCSVLAERVKRGDFF